MTDTTTDRAIGRLEGKVDALIRAVEAQGVQSSESRAKLYQSIEKLTMEAHSLDRRLEVLEATVKVMDPLVQHYGQMKQRGLGILAVLAFVWLILGGLILQGISWLGAVIVKAVSGGG